MRAKNNVGKKRGVRVGHLRLQSVVPTGLICLYSLVPALKCRAIFNASLTGRILEFGHY